MGIRVVGPKPKLNRGPTTLICPKCCNENATTVAKCLSMIMRSSALSSFSEMLGNSSLAEKQ
ncbi:BnaA04g10390D [Brassica napus]|uniref:BnaA04g10390D protein n=1 Tax=Brassica napus TaxID=3708 RepID=A0A078HZ36_BRANA|nr:BnaA04g10390D [Brassica napus]